MLGIRWEAAISAQYSHEALYSIALKARYACTALGALHTALQCPVHYEGKEGKAVHRLAVKARICSHSVSIECSSLALVRDPCLTQLTDIIRMMTMMTMMLMMMTMMIMIMTLLIDKSMKVWKLV